ncbi:MAG: hypothetical protein IPJ82_12115 [Lewinellaceae bacterium]|nr:hypothetical protein [Lewinellaceae bacterium]
MTVDRQILYLLEEFKIPIVDPHCPEDWKDWYHYILYDPVSNIRLLYNLCFNGRPGTGYVTDTFFLTVPKGFVRHRLSDLSEMETYGFARNMDWNKENLVVQPLRFETDDILFSICDDNTRLSVANPQSHTSFNLQGQPFATPIYVPELAPYGNGFIGWGVVPGFKMRGKIRLGLRLIEVDESWFCYHDRNFGRFNWGNIGWSWFVLNAKDKEGRVWTYVFHRGNDNAFNKIGSPILFVYCEHKMKKVFLGEGVDIQFVWSKKEEMPPVLPGAMASVFGDRSILAPVSVSVKAADETDYVALKMIVQTHTEMIVPDSEKKQYTFIKELSGHANAIQFFDQRKSACKNGFFYAEHVH